MDGGCATMSSMMSSLEVNMRRPWLLHCAAYGVRLRVPLPSFSGGWGPAAGPSALLRSAPHPCSSPEERGPHADPSRVVAAVQRARV